MIQKIKNWWSNYKVRIQKKRKERLNQEVHIDYNVIERHGNLYLVAGSHAVAKIEKTTTVEEVIRMIDKARIAQISYRNSGL